MNRYEGYQNQPVENSLPNSYTSLQRRSLIDHTYLKSQYLTPIADNQTANQSMSGLSIPSSPATKGYLMPVANNEAATHPLSHQQIPSTSSAGEAQYTNGVAYENFPGLHDFTASQLTVQSFQLQSFSLNPSTSALLLDFNELETLPDEVLKLSNLKYLSVCSQSSPKRASITHWPQLTTIPDRISNLTILKEFIANNNALQDLPMEFTNLTSLRKLDLSLNYFWHFPDALCKMAGLEELILSGNYIEHLPEEINDLRSLKIFRIANNKLSRLPGSIAFMRSLEYLSLRNNALQELPLAMAEHPVMHGVMGENKGITLEGNELRYPPQQIVDRSIAEAVQYMRTTNPRPVTGLDFQLDVTERKMRSLQTSSEGSQINISSHDPPFEVLSLDLPSYGKIPSHATHLDASGNKIRVVDDSIGSLTSLESLVLDNNRLVTLLPSLLTGLGDLKLLSLSKQKFPQSRRSQREDYLPMNQMPNHLYLCTNLRELYLNSNKIVKISEDIAHIPNLEILDLIDNHIQSVPSSLCSNLAKLKYLGLSSNMITSLPDNIGDFKSLQVLRLSGNKLVYLPNSICLLGFLITLSLSRNRLVYLPSEFFKLVGLLPSNNASFHISHTDRSFGPSLDLYGNETTLIYPNPKICLRDDQVITDEMFKYMRFVNEKPDLLRKEMEKAKKHLPMDHQDHSPPALKFDLHQPTILTDRVLSKLACYIGREWHILGMVLGLESHVLYQIQHSKQDLRATTVEMLTVWRNLNLRNKSEEELLKELMDALAQEEVGRGDIKSMFATGNGLPSN